MAATIFLTVLSGVITYVLGQVIVKLVIDPVQGMKKSIGEISHALVERAHVIANPGVLEQQLIDDTSQTLRRLSSELHSHLYLIPSYRLSSKAFGLPTAAKVRLASATLIGLSNGVFRATDRVYEQNARAKEVVCDSLGIHMEADERWPRDLEQAEPAAPADRPAAASRRQVRG